MLTWTLQAILAKYRTEICQFTKTEMTGINVSVFDQNRSPIIDESSKAIVLCNLNYINFQKIQHHKRHV